MRAVVTSAAFELLLGAWVLGFALTSCAEQRSEPPLVIVDLYADRGCPHCAPATRVMERVAEAWSRDVQVRHHHLHLPSHRSEQSGTVEAASPRDAQVAGLLDVRAIPTIWVNGRRVLGPATFAAVAPLVRAELATAQMLVRSGTARPEVPAARARQNLGDPRRAGWLLGLEEPPENLPGTAPRTTAQPEPPSAIPDDARWAVPIDATSPTRGAADTSLVTIVLFEDLASPFCRRLPSVSMKPS